MTKLAVCIAIYLTVLGIVPAQEDKGKATAPAKEHEIKTPAELASHIKQAKPGDVLVLPAGTLRDWMVEISTSGTKDALITIKGRGPDKTIFTGNSAIQIKGASYIHLKDFGFSDKKGTAVSFQSARDCLLTNASFTTIQEASSIIDVSGNSQRNQIASCHFFKNPSMNIRIVIGSQKSPRKTIIRDNLFEDVPPIGENGRETIQVGQNQPVYGTVQANTLVKNNRFVRCNGEAEIISNKCSGNHYTGNIFIDCGGELVMRGGSGCTIESNRFEGCSGGIRLSGKNHIVRNNVIWKSRGTGIRLLYGVSDTPPAFYQAVSGCMIENNTIVNSKAAGILVGVNRGIDLLNSPENRKKLTGNPKRYGTHFKMTVAPHNNTFRRNVVFNQHADLITTDQAPQNVFKDNLGFSQQAKAESDDKYDFGRLEFADLDGGDLTLKATDKKTAAKGARGKVCEAVPLTTAESGLSNQ
jgi:poly(beta-D-mannuronate) lyase